MSDNNEIFDTIDVILYESNKLCHINNIKSNIKLKGSNDIVLRIIKVFDSIIYYNIEHNDYTEILNMKFNIILNNISRMYSNTPNYLGDISNILDIYGKYLDKVFGSSE